MMASMDSSTKARRLFGRRCVILLGAAALLAACAGDPTNMVGYPVHDGKKGDGRTARATTLEDYDAKRKTLFGEGGLSNMLGNKKGSDEGGGGIGVNSFLWRASLDTISFMPVNSVDPFGGVIITDWQSPQGAPNERFKLNIYIIGRTLRADGLKVAVFRQIKDPSAGWVDASTPEQTAPRIEDAILTKARQLRNSSIAQN